MYTQNLYWENAMWIHFPFFGFSAYVQGFHFIEAYVRQIDPPFRIYHTLMSNIAVIIITAGEAYVRQIENEFKIVALFGEACSFSSFLETQKLEALPNRVAILSRSKSVMSQQLTYGSTVHNYMSP